MPSMRHEFRALMRLAVPSTLSTFCFFAISITELSVMGHLGVDQLAAVAYSQMSMDFSTLVFTQGFNTGMNALCSQAFGAKNYRLVGNYMQLTCFIQTIMCVPLAMLWWHLGTILSKAGVLPQVVAYAAVYCRWSILSLWSRAMFQVLSIFFQSQQIVLPTACINVAFVLINFLLTTGLTYGKLPFLPALGFIGCPIGTAIALSIRLGVYVFYMHTYKRYHHKCIPRSFTWRFLRRDLFQKLTVVGLPLAMGNLFENAQLQTMALFSATIGEVQLGTHNSLMELFFFATSPIYGVINGSVTRIGGHLGAGKAAHAHQVAKLVAICIAVLAVVNSTIMATCRHVLGRIFSNDAAVLASFASVASLGAIAYIVLSFFYYSIAVLQAQARSTPVMVAFSIGAWVVGVPSAYWLGLGSGRKDLLGIWIGMLCGYTVSAAIAFYAAYCKTDWEAETKKAVERSKRKKEVGEEQDPLLP